MLPLEKCLIALGALVNVITSSQFYCIFLKLQQDDSGTIGKRYRGHTTTKPIDRLYGGGDDDDIGNASISGLLFVSTNNTANDFNTTICTNFTNHDDTDSVIGQQTTRINYYMKKTMTSLQTMRNKWTKETSEKIRIIPTITDNNKNHILSTLEVTNLFREAVRLAITTAAEKKVTTRERIDESNRKKDWRTRRSHKVSFIRNVPINKTFLNVSDNSSSNSEEEDSFETILVSHYNLGYNDSNITTNSINTTTSTKTTTTNNTQRYPNQPNQAQQQQQQQQEQHRIAEIRVYAPQIFQQLRTYYGINEKQYETMMIHSPYTVFTTNSKGTERIGGIFFTTQDGTYIIKTIKPDETMAFLGRSTRPVPSTTTTTTTTPTTSTPFTPTSFLQDYYMHMKQYGNTSLLSKICGIYEIRYPMSSNRLHNNTNSTNTENIHRLQHHQRKYTFIVMNSVFPSQAAVVPTTKKSTNQQRMIHSTRRRRRLPPPPILITERYDLKGSTLGRKCSLSERHTKGIYSVLKDVDFIERVGGDEKRMVVIDPDEDNTTTKNSDSMGTTRCSSSTSSGGGIFIGSDQKKELFQQLKHDVELLQRNNMIDYSLLLGIAPIPVTSSSSSSSQTKKKVWKMLFSSLWFDDKRNRKCRYKNPNTNPHLQERMLLVQSSTKQQQQQPQQRIGFDCGTFSKLKGLWRTKTTPALTSNRTNSSSSSETDHHSSQQQKQQQQQQPQQCDYQQEDAIFYIGVIDFLQPYDSKKQLEYYMKSMVYDSFKLITTTTTTTSRRRKTRNDTNTCDDNHHTNTIATYSCVPSFMYAKRFLSFLDTYIS